MLWNKPPSKLEQARRAAAEAAQKAAETAQSAANSAALSAQSLLSTASQSASVAGDVLSAKASALLHREDDSVEAARAKAVISQKAAEVAAKEAEAAARDAQRKAEEEIARYERELAQKRAEFEAQQNALAAHQQELAQTRDELARSKEEMRVRRTRQVEVEDAPVELKSAPVRFEVPDADEDVQLRVVDEREGGSPLLLILGGVVALGALAYFLVIKKGGSQSELQSRLSQVKEQVVDKAKDASDGLKSSTASSSAPVVASSQNPGETEIEVLGRELDAVAPPVSSTIVAGANLSSSENGGTVDGISVDPDLNPEPIDEATAAQHAEETPKNENEVAPLFAEEGAQHPNIFDKVTEVVGHAADATEHMAGGDQNASETKEDGGKSKSARKGKSH